MARWRTSFDRTSPSGMKPERKESAVHAMRKAGAGHAGVVTASVSGEAFEVVELGEIYR